MVGARVSGLGGHEGFAAVTGPIVVAVGVRKGRRCTRPGHVCQGEALRHLVGVMLGARSGP